MRRHTRAVTAVLTGLALLALTATPAAATTVDVAYTAGQIEIYGPFETTPEAITPLTGTGCTSTHTLTATDLTPTTGTLALTLANDFEVLNPFGDGVHYHMTRTTVLSGTYSYSGGTLALTGTSHELISRRTAPCTGATTTCTVTAININATGALTTGTFPTLAGGDTLTFAGGNYDFETVVLGSGCGGFSAFDNGHIQFTAELQVQ